MVWVSLMSRNEASRKTQLMRAMIGLGDHLSMEIGPA